jgi:hypothetical protein
MVLSDSPRRGAPDARLSPKAVFRDTHQKMTEESTTPDLAELPPQVADAMSSRDLAR